LEDGGLVLFHPKRGNFVLLNVSGALVWNGFAVPRTIDEIAEQLCAKFPGLPVATAHDDAFSAISELLELELLSLESASNSS